MMHGNMKLKYIFLFHCNQCLCDADSEPKKIHLSINVGEALRPSYFMASVLVIECDLLNALEI
jgi:hypothetical protein